MCPCDPSLGCISVHAVYEVNSIMQLSILLYTYTESSNLIGPLPCNNSCYSILDILTVVFSYTWPV